MQAQWTEQLANLRSSLATRQYELDRSSATLEDTRAESRQIRIENERLSRRADVLRDELAEERAEHSRVTSALESRLHICEAHLREYEALDYELESVATASNSSSIPDPARKRILGHSHTMHRMVQLASQVAHLEEELRQAGRAKEQLERCIDELRDEVSSVFRNSFFFFSVGFFLLPFRFEISLQTEGLKENEGKHRSKGGGEGESLHFTIVFVGT